MTTTVGFLGLGTMGRPMARNLLRAGHALTVWNRSPAPAHALQAEGAVLAASPAQAATGPLLFSMLADDEAVRQTLLEGGALEALPAGSVHVNMATVSVTLAREMHALHAERGVAYVAAPVLGREDVAAAGQLNILAAGDAHALARARPLLDALGSRTWHFGDAPERANAVKLAANFCLASAIGTMAEASALVQGHGVERGAFLELLTGTLFAAPAYQVYAGLIAGRRYHPAGFTATLGRKDVDLALAAAALSEVPMPLAQVLRDGLDEAIAQGLGDADWSVVAEVAGGR